MNIELCSCEQTLLREIGDKEFKQINVAKTYGLSLRSSERDVIDWEKVNKAIIARWSKSGLQRIKEIAWSGDAFVVKVRATGKWSLFITKIEELVEGGDTVSVGGADSARLKELCATKGWKCVKPDGRRLWFVSKE